MKYFLKVHKNILDILYSEYHNWILWIPVLMYTGILIYLYRYNEPSNKEIILLTVISLSSFIAHMKFL